MDTTRTTATGMTTTTNTSTETNVSLHVPGSSGRNPQKFVRKRHHPQLNRHGLVTCDYALPENHAASKRQDEELHEK